MSRVVELPDALAEALTEEASRLGLSLPDYAVRLLTSARLAARPIHSGAALVDFWRSEGLLGTRSDSVDPQAEARRLREQAERRGS